ncbi:helix-turn-helix transcriptional regulator [Naasia aerilata]|uniref:helix-turn-helix transcriptional regulator n=1 Tax=Naasia aerilata TaxID=1162966 RepID=UPI002573728F|nr:helix-turn-helix domain-containing protein [Naasia aerilata]
MDELAAESVLADPVRRALYRLILASSPDPVSRGDAADALGLPKSTVAAHLARMARDGVLVVSMRKTGERSGPGSGRPAAFYSAAAPDVAISIPPRRYDLMGDLLAGAVEDAVERAPQLAAELRATATARGRAMGQAAGGVEQALQDNGYEPVRDEDGFVLANCPFHRLSRSHRDVVCLLNGALLQGVVEGSGVAASVDAVPVGSPAVRGSRTAPHEPARLRRSCRPASGARERAPTSRPGRTWAGPLRRPARRLPAPRRGC